MGSVFNINLQDCTGMVKNLQVSIFKMKKQIRIKLKLHDRKRKIIKLVFFLHFVDNRDLLIVIKT